MVFHRRADPGPQPNRLTPFRRTDQNALAPMGPSEAQPLTAMAQPASTLPDQSVIGSDLSIEGQAITIRCKGLLRVNGNIQADVHSRELDVGREAIVSGAITADSVDVHGRVNGAIFGNKVVLHGTAEVEGDIHSQFLSIEHGASFDGRSRRVRDQGEIVPQLEPNMETTRRDAHSGNGTANGSYGTAPGFNGRSSLDPS